MRKKTAPKKTRPKPRTRRERPRPLTHRASRDFVGVAPASWRKAIAPMVWATPENSIL